MSVTTTTPMALFKGLNRHLAGPSPTAGQCHRRLSCVAASYNYYSILSLTSCRARALLPRIPCRFRCVSSSAASSGRGKGGESGGGEKLVAEGDGELSALSPDAIVLHVKGMMCDGCAANVKRNLESRPQVSSASVNLTTEIAIVWPVSEAKTTPNWQKQLGEALAEHLTSCGFDSSLQGQEDSN